MPVDIMPGPDDPANFSLPQQVFCAFLCITILTDQTILYVLIAYSHVLFQPLHRCLFPGASVYNTFMSCTNPHSFELDDVR